MAPFFGCEIFLPHVLTSCRPRGPHQNRAQASVMSLNLQNHERNKPLYQVSLPLVFHYIKAKHSNNIVTIFL